MGAGDLVIPGVTDIRPDLLDADGRPIHIPVQSNAQGIASGAMIGAMIGGPVGLAAIGGPAMVAAAEYLAAGLKQEGEPGAPDQPAEPWRDAQDPWRDLPG